MPTIITEEQWKQSIAEGIYPVVEGLGCRSYDLLAQKNDDGTVTRYDTIQEALAARSAFYFEMGLVRFLVVTTHQSMEPHDSDAIVFNSVWGWRSEPMECLGGQRQTRAPREFSDAAIERAKKEVARLHAETGRTTTLYERHLNVNRVLYVRG